MDKTHYDSYLQGLGKQIRRIRKDKGLTMEKLALKAEIDFRQLGRIERGEGNTTVVSLLRIAEVMEIDIVEFFTK